MEDLEVDGDRRRSNVSESEQKRTQVSGQATPSIHQRIVQRNLDLGLDIEQGPLPDTQPSEHVTEFVFIKTARSATVLNS